MAAGLAKRMLRPWVAAAAPVLRPVSGLLLWQGAMQALKQQGFAPKTVFDIGVADGTPELYAAFPEAQYHLVDPTPEALPHMQAIAGQMKAEVHNLALGDQDGEIEIETRADDIQGATLFREIGPLGETARHRVPMRRFDSLFQDFARPALCKIDVQGAELMVLRGLGVRARAIDVVIVEASTISTLEGAPEIFDIVAEMQSLGFVIYDILGLRRRPLDHALAQVDLLFVPEGSRFRADHRWSAG